MKFVGNTTGANDVITLPQNWNTLLIIGTYYYDSQYYVGTSCIIKNQSKDIFIGSNEVRLNTRWYVTSTYVVLNTAWYEKVSVAPNVETTVYYI